MKKVKVDCKHSKDTVGNPDITIIREAQESDSLVVKVAGHESFWIERRDVPDLVKALAKALVKL